MQIEEIIPTKQRIVRLVEQACEGKLCLPNFQRDFVWTREEVADLLRSMLRRYYIGSLLLLRCDPRQPPFDPIPLRGANPSEREMRPEILILDGQQRLSSLIYALTAPDLSLKDSSKRRWFFVDLDLLLREPDNDGIVFDRARNEMNGLEKNATQYEKHVLPCNALLRSQDFFTWRDGCDDYLREFDPDLHQVFRADFRDPWTKIVTDFQSFEVPLVELPRVDEDDSNSIGRVCAIFEKLNSTGVELSVYDLLTARMYRHGIRLHDLWKQSCHSNERLRLWSKGKAGTSKFGVLVLRTLALMRGLDPKPRMLINLEPDKFEVDWHRAAAAMERALELVTHVGEDGFGVFATKWLPGFGMIPALAALRAEIEERDLGENARRELRRWYWCNVFLERFSSGVESKSRKDYSEMLAHWTNDAPEPAVFAEARARIGASGYSIRSSASYASAVYSGVFCLLAIRGARDWTRGENIQLQKLNDHHIFPKAYLRDREITKKIEVNSILNRTLISNQTNQKIRATAPADYLANQDVLPPMIADELLTVHFINEDARRMMRAATDNVGAKDVARLYEEFCHIREREIVGEIRRVCGIDPLWP